MAEGCKLAGRLCCFEKVDKVNNRGTVFLTHGHLSAVQEAHHRDARVGAAPPVGAKSKDSLQVVQRRLGAMVGGWPAGRGPVL